MNKRNSVILLVIFIVMIIVVRSSSYKYRWNWPLTFEGYDFTSSSSSAARFVDPNSPEGITMRYDERINAMREKLATSEKKLANQMESSLKSLEDFYSAKLKSVEDELLRTRRSRSGSFSVTNTVLENVLRNNNGRRWVYLCDWMRCASGSEYDSAMWLVRRYLQSRGALALQPPSSSSTNSNNYRRDPSTTTPKNVVIRIVHLIGRCDSQMHRATRDVTSAAAVALRRQTHQPNYTSSVFAPGVSIRLRHVKLRDFDFKNCTSSSSSSLASKPSSSSTSISTNEENEDGEASTTMGEEIEEVVEEDARALAPPSLSAAVSDTRWIDILAVDAPPRGELSKPVVFNLLAKWMGRVKTSGLVMGSGYVADFALESGSPGGTSATSSIGGGGNGNNNANNGMSAVMASWRRDAAVKAEVDRYRLSDENELGQEESIYVAGGNVYYFYRIKPKILG